MERTAAECRAQMEPLERALRFWKTELHKARLREEPEYAASVERHQNRVRGADCRSYPHGSAI